MTAPTTEERPVPTPGMRAGMAAPATRHGLCETARHWAVAHPDEPFPISPLLLVALCEHADEQASELRVLRSVARAAQRVLGLIEMQRYPVWKAGMTYEDGTTVGRALQALADALATLKQEGEGVDAQPHRGA